MAEIKLSKPLYKDNDVPTVRSGGGSDSPASAAASMPRPAKAMVAARAGAMVLDVLVLHGLFFGFLKMLPDVAVHLGNAGPWLGLAICFIYFAIGFGPVTQGRTVGKFILKLRVADLAGPELPMNRAAQRAGMLLWPLVLYLFLRQVGEANDSPEQLSIVPYFSQVAGGLAVGWYLGNLLHAAFDPFGRTSYDRIASSAVVAMDSSGDTLQEFLRAAREGGDSTRSGRARVVLWVCVLGLPAILGFNLWQTVRLLDNQPAEERARMIETRKELAIGDFGLPRLLPAPRDDRSGQGETSPTQSMPTAYYQYLRRAPIAVESLKRDPRVTGAAERISHINHDELVRQMAKGTDLRTSIPKEVLFKVGFAEYSDLLFAWHAEEVFSVSHTADFSDLTTQTVSVESVTTGTH